MSMRDCPYYRRYYALPGHDPRGICSFGCREEPSCITDEPLEGWPWKETRVWIDYPDGGELEITSVVRYEEVVAEFGPVRSMIRHRGIVERQHDEVSTWTFDGAPRPWKLPHGRRRWRRR